MRLRYSFREICDFELSAMPQRFELCMDADLRVAAQ